MALWGVVHESRDVTRLLERMDQAFTGIRMHKVAGSRNCAFAVKLKPTMASVRDGCASSPDGALHVAFSGEIANRADLLSSFPQLIPSTVDDALLFVHLFSRDGAQCIRRISGQFCAAVWDEPESRLTLLLDRAGGVKSLYYVRMPGGLAFCSRLQPLLTLPEMKREINAAALHELFATGYVLPPNTLMEGISKLAPGEAVSVSPQGFSVTTVDRVCFTASAGVRGDPEELAMRLGTAVARRSLEPETGFLLSGGIDSSILVATAAQRTGRRVTTFTAAFPGSPLDESPYAALVANANRCPNHTIPLSSSRSLDELPEIMWHLEEPFLDDSVIPTFHLFRQIKQATSVIVSGDGPDHLFGRYYALAAKCFIRQNYKAATDLLSALHVPPFKKAWCSLAGGHVPVADAYQRLFSIPAWGEHRSALLKDLLEAKPHLNGVHRPYTAGLLSRQARSLDEFITDVSAVDFYVDGSFGVFTKVGKMAQANDLLLREPYLDLEVSAYLAALPRASKIQGNLLHLLKAQARTKYLLKFGLGTQLLPRQIIEKRKGGFVPPLALWLKDFLAATTIHDKLCNTLLDHGYINPATLEQMTAEHRQGIRDWSTIIFMTISLDLWTRLFIENAFSSFPGWKLSDVYSSVRPSVRVPAVALATAEQPVSGIAK